MIDLHCHILPDFHFDVAHSLGEDIGPEAALEAAVEAGRLAVQQGISRIVATPHIHLDMNRAQADNIASAAQRLNEKLTERGLNLQIVSGAELAFCEEIADVPDLFPKYTIGTGRYLLVEPPLYSLPLAADDIFRRLLAKGFTPILAHPERVAELQGDVARLKRLVDCGVLVQITAVDLIGSGWSGRGLRRTCERLLSEGLVHFVASDAHFGNDKLFAMVPAWQKLVKRWGQEVAAALMHNNAQAVIEGRPI